MYSEDFSLPPTISGGSLPIALVLCAVVVTANVVHLRGSSREESVPVSSAAEYRVLPPIASLPPSALEFAHCMGKCKDD